MTIVAGAKYCPVCLKNGTGRRPDGYGGGDGYAVTPCKMPWEEPIGVLAEDFEVGSFAKVQQTGDFELTASLIDPASGDIFVGNMNHREQQVGKRVYYDYDNSIYVIEYASTLGDQAPDSGDIKIGKYPGSATIGYIVAVAGAKLTVRIDPRPATAKYIVAHAAYIGTLPAIGDPIQNNQLTNSISSQTSIICDGVVAGVYPVAGSEFVPVVICVSGPAWITPTISELFAYADLDDLKADYKFPRRIGVAATLAFMPIIYDMSQYRPYIGYVDLRSWDEIDTTDEDAVVRLLVDVRPNNPSWIANVPLLAEDEEATK